MASLYGMVPPARVTLDEGLDWVGYHVEGLNGAPLGARVEDLYADCGSGEVHWLLTSVGRFGRSQVVIPAIDAVAGAGHVLVPYSRAQIRAAPNVGGAESLSKTQETALCAHYGLLSHRGAEIATRPAGEITAVRANGIDQAA